MSGAGFNRMVTPDRMGPATRSPRPPGTVALEGGALVSAGAAEFSHGATGSGDVSPGNLKRSSTISIGRPRPVRDAVGRLRVRCISASPPANADVRLLLRPWSSLNTYMVVYLRDQNQKQSPQRRTRAIPRTQNPQWREEFWFALSKKSEGVVLHVDVMDQDDKKDDTCLGTAMVALDSNFLRDATHKRQLCDLELFPPAGVRRTAGGTPGTARVEISWEPSLVLNSASSARAMLWVMLRSPNILRVVGVALLGTACCCLFVAMSSRWLCRGPSLSRCQTDDVPGAASCAFFSALGALMGGSVHFLGSAGLFGLGWDDRPPTMVELAEADLEDDEGNTGREGDEDGRSSLRLSIQSSGAFPASLRWDVDITTNFLPKFSIFPLRLFAWLLHLASLSMAELALILCWANSDDTTFFAEAAYLAIGSVCCLVFAGVVFWHEGRVLRAQADKWGHAEEDATTRMFGRNTVTDGTGGSGETNSPSLNLEDLAQRAQRQLQEKMETVQANLAQPLMEARQRLQGRLGALDDPNVREDLMRPLLDARQRLQDSLDELNLPQPLADARQRIQEQLDTLQTLSDGSGDTRSPHSRTNRALTLPPRWQSEEIARWMQPLFNFTGQQQDGGPMTASASTPSPHSRAARAEAPMARRHSSGGLRGEIGAWEDGHMAQQHQRASHVSFGLDSAPDGADVMMDASNPAQHQRRISFGMDSALGVDMAQNLGRGSTLSAAHDALGFTADEDLEQPAATATVGGAHEPIEDSEPAVRPSGRGFCCRAQLP